MNDVFMNIFIILFLVIMYIYGFKFIKEKDKKNFDYSESKNYFYGKVIEVNFKDKRDNNNYLLERINYLKVCYLSNGQYVTTVVETKSEFIIGDEVKLMPDSNGNLKIISSFVDRDFENIFDLSFESPNPYLGMGIIAIACLLSIVVITDILSDITRYHNIIGFLMSICILIFICYKILSFLDKKSNKIEMGIYEKYCAEVVDIYYSDFVGSIKYMPIIEYRNRRIYVDTYVDINNYTNLYLYRNRETGKLLTQESVDLIDRFKNTLLIVLILLVISLLIVCLIFIL